MRQQLDKITDEIILPIWVKHIIRITKLRSIQYIPANNICIVKMENKKQLIYILRLQNSFDVTRLENGSYLVKPTPDEE